MNNEQNWVGKRVLVVEDSEIMRDEIAALYNSLGIEVVAQAKNGVEALEKIEAQKPDFVSMDIIMPEMHGIDCCRIVHKKYPEIPVLFLSCLTSAPVMQKAFEAEFPLKNFVEKPPKKEILQECMSNLFAQRDAESKQA